MPDNQPPIQVQCTCSCSDKTPAINAEDDTWREALRLHRGGIIELVSNRYSFLDWMYRFFRFDPPELDSCGYRISLAELHRLHMRMLQIELIKIGTCLQFDGYAPEKERFRRSRENLEPVLAKYIQAVRDYEYMTSRSNAYDFFIASYERHHDKSIIHQVVSEYDEDRRAFNEREGKRVRSTGPWEKPIDGSANPIGGTRNETMKSLIRHAFWWRVGAATVGAGFLVGPMWLLTLNQRLYLQLEATTGFILGFGLVLSFFMEKTDQVFAGTLAYAAVLMVFVGLSVQNSEEAKK